MIRAKFTLAGVVAALAAATGCSSTGRLVVQDGYRGINTPAAVPARVEGPAPLVPGTPAIATRSSGGVEIR